jgi:hypothetical protein
LQQSMEPNFKRYTGRIRTFDYPIAGIEPDQPTLIGRM